MKCNWHIKWVLLLSVLYSLLPLSALAQEASGDASDQEAGKKIYGKWCVNCHGVEGAGDGPAADFLTPRPRDFTFGLYKIRSTESGQLPTDEDLISVISKGMPGTGMPSWTEVLNDGEVRQVVEYIKAFSGKFARAKNPPKVIQMGNPSKSTPESIARGKELFTELECFKCHGDEGRGDGPSAVELEDDWEYPIWPRNMTRGWEFRGGHRPEDIFRRVMGGVSGTPMPSFADSLDEAKTWDLVHYVLSLSSDEPPPLRFVLNAKKIEGELPGDPDDLLWSQAESAEYPLVGQTIQDPRMFTPTVKGVQVQALYNMEAIALRFSWDDPTFTEPDPDAEIDQDALAVQFPVEISKGTKRPYFLMGDSDRAVNLWKWGTGQSGVMEFNAKGMDYLEEQSSSGQEVEGSVLYKNGQYQLVMTRSLETGDIDEDIQFVPGEFISIAFFIWDGFNYETGKQMAISHWYYLLLEPPVTTKVYIYPPLAVVLAAGFQWWFIRRLRRSSK